MKRLTEIELSQRWDITTRTLQSWRKAKKGPPFIRIGERSLFYREEDVLAYEESCLVDDRTDWRGPVKRAASALDVLAKRAATPEAQKTLSSLRDELRALLA